MSWAVVCDDYRNSGHKTSDAAERELARIVAIGACQADHRVEEDDRG